VSDHRAGSIPALGTILFHKQCKPLINESGDFLFLPYVISFKKVSERSFQFESFIM
jgi:hypothetical protein